MEKCQRCGKTTEDCDGALVGIFGGYTANLCVACVNLAVQLVRPYEAEHYRARSKAQHLNAQSNGDGRDRFAEIEPLLSRMLELEQIAFNAVAAWVMPQKEVET